MLPNVNHIKLANWVSLNLRKKGRLFFKFYLTKSVFVSADVLEPSALDLLTVSDNVFSSCYARGNSLVAIGIFHIVTWVSESLSALCIKRGSCILVVVCLPSDAFHIHLYIWFWVEFSTSAKELNKDPLTLVSQDCLCPILPIKPIKQGLVLTVCRPCKWEERVFNRIRLGIELDWMSLAE